MIRRQFLNNLAVVAVLAAVYFIAGKLGLRLAFVHVSASPVWPPTGIALAAFLVLGYRVWPGILLGAFLVNLTTAGSVATSVGIAMGNTLEGLMGSYLVNRFAHGRNAFDRAQDIFKFTLLAAMVSTALSATFGVTSLALGGFADWAKYGPIWWTWWQGDAVGALVVTPCLLLWSARPRVRWNQEQVAEATTLLLLLVLVGMTIFGGLFHAEVKNHPLEFLCIPFLIWAAFRFGQLEAATAIVMLSGMAIWGTLHGFGPFVRQTQNESLLLLQAFMGIIAVTNMVLAAEVTAHRRSEERVRQMALSDPLTGLANYRHLVDALDAEIKRFARTGRSLAVLLLDLDGLKKINDSYGHLVGSRALCRLADVLRVQCRGTDTAARYGGDEFAVVLPETGPEGAQQLARRIAEHLAKDAEQPPLSVSIGSAICSQDGQTVAQLLGAADRALYSQKGQTSHLGAPLAHDSAILRK
jgi:diguanylate cyclase (GGDEF)-like protein